MKPPWHTTMSKFSKTLYFSLGRWGSQERMAGVAFCFFLIPAFLVHNCLPQCLGYNTVFFKKIFISYANWLYIYLCDRGFFICLFCFVYIKLTVCSSLKTSCSLLQQPLGTCCLPLYLSPLDGSEV